MSEKLKCGIWESLIDMFLFVLLMVMAVLLWYGAFRSPKVESKPIEMRVKACEDKIVVLEKKIEEHRSK